MKIDEERVAARAATISFATFGDGRQTGRSREPYSGFASVDLGEEEARSVLASLPREVADSSWEVTDVRGASLLNPDTLRSLLRPVNDRFLVGLYDRRQLVARSVVGLLLGRSAFSRPKPEPLTRVKSKLFDALEGHLVAHETFAAAVLRLDRILAERDPAALVDAVASLSPDEELEALLRSNGLATVERLERFRPATLFDVMEPAERSVAFHAHQDAWGRRHRLIATTRDSGPVTLDTIAPDQPRYNTWDWYGPCCRRGHWVAWRATGPAAVVEPGASAPLRVARLIAAAAVFLKTSHDPQASSAGHASVTLHYFGRVPFSDELVAEHERQRDTCYAESSSRDTLWSFAAEQDTRLSDASRLSYRIGTGGVREARDRLLLKCLGAGVGPGSLLPLRLETLDVDAANDLLDLTASLDKRILPMDSDDWQDLWTLVRANEGTEGYLFSALVDDARYGRRKLSRTELDAIVAGRAAEFPLPGDDLAAA